MPNTVNKGAMEWSIYPPSGAMADGLDHDFGVQLDIDTRTVTAHTAKRLQKDGRWLIVGVGSIFGETDLLAMAVNSLRFDGLPRLDLRLEWDARRLRLFVNGVLRKDAVV